MDSTQIIMLLFFGATLAIGLWRFRRVDSFQKYAFGDGKIHTGILAISFIATFVGAGDLVFPEDVYSFGLVANTEIIGYSFVFLCFIFFLSKKLAKKRGLLTISDVMRDSYGNHVGLLSSCIGILSSLVIAAVQLSYLRGIGEKISGLDPTLFTFLVGLALTIYIATGGLRAVAFTDLLQLCFVVVIVVYLTQEGVMKAIGKKEGGFISFCNKIKEQHNEKLLWISSEDRSAWCQLSLFWGFFPAFLLSPPLLQRMLMSKPQKVRSVFWAGFFFYPLLRFFLTLIGLSALVLLPNLQGRELSLTSFSNELFGRNSWITGLTLVGTIALSLSTADSFLHSAVVLAMRDMVRPVLVKKNFSKRRVLWITRGLACLFVWLTLLISGEAVVVNLSINNVLFYSIALLSLITIPLLVAINGWRGSARPVWWAVGLSGFVFIVAHKIAYQVEEGSLNEIEKLLALPKYHAWFCAIAVNAVTFFFFKFLEGKKKEKRQAAKLWEPQGPSWGARFTAWLSVFRNPVEEAQRKVSKHGSFPFVLTWFLFILYMVPTWHPNHGVIDVIRILGILFCVGLLARSVWPAGLQRYFSLYYLATIIYCLPFASTVLFFTQPDNEIAKMVIFLSFLLLVVLVDWKSFCLFTLLGIAGGILFHYFYLGSWLPILGWEVWASMLGGLTFTVFIGLLFIRKERWMREIKYQALLDKTVSQASELQVTKSTKKQVLSLLSPRSSVISEAHNHLATLRKRGVEKELLEQISHALYHLEAVKKQHDSYLPLKPEKVSFKRLFAETAKRFKTLELLHPPLLVNRLSKDYCVGDKAYIVTLMVNALQYMQENDSSGEYYVYGVDTQINYSDQEGNGHSMAGYRLVFSNEEQSLFPPSAKVDFAISPPEEKNPLLQQNRQIVHAHFGTMELMENEEGTITQSYLFPYDLHGVRPKIGELVDEHYLGNTKLDAEEDLAFLQLVRENSLDENILRKALLDCKHYHRGQARKSGEPYYLHPLRVATSLLAYTQDPDMIIAALLHDTIEDTPYTSHQIKVRYSVRAGELVEAVTNLYGSNARKVKLKKKEKFKKLLEKAEKGAMMIKLFDRLDNIRTLAGHPSEAKRRAVAQETQDFFLPIAKVLKLKEVEKEMREIIKKYCEVEEDVKF